MIALQNSGFGYWLVPAVIIIIAGASFFVIDRILEKEKLWSLRASYWLLLSMSGLFVLFLSPYPTLLESTTPHGTQFLIVIWIVILLLPFFSEFDLFGIKLKKAVEKATKELRDQVNQLQLSVNKSSSSSEARQNNHIFVGNPPPPADSELKELEVKFKRMLNEELRKYGLSPSAAPQALEVPNDVIELFTVRYRIELELRRILESRGIPTREMRNNIPSLMTRSLIQNEILSPRLGNIVKEVYSVCSFAMHGQSVSKEKLAFVRELYPELLSALEAIR